MSRFDPDNPAPFTWCKPGDSGRPIVWSYGGGTQTAAIAALVLRGDLPRPDCIVMADTAREASATWNYLRDVIGPALATAGLEVEIASHDLATKDLYSGKGKPLMPLYSTENGETGMLANYCSGEWKRNVVRRYLRQRGYGPENPVEMWYGMSADELGRLKTSDRKWMTTAWPLAMPPAGVPARSRSACVALVEEMGWPEPPKSSCWMCPYRSNAQWRLLRDEYPADWRLAVEVEKELQASDTGSDALYTLHESGLSLEDASAAGLLDDQQGDFFQDIACTSGGCWT